MGTSPWWFTPLMTFAGVVFGGAVSIITTWLTQRYSLRAQLAIKTAEAETALRATLRVEREKRYLSIVQNVEALYATAGNPDRKAEFLKAVREVWLVGDQELVRKLHVFLVNIAGERAAAPHEQSFGDAVLDMRKGSGLPIDQLSNQDFRFHLPGTPPSR